MEPMSQRKKPSPSFPTKTPIGPQNRMQGRLLYANGAGQQIRLQWGIEHGEMLPKELVDAASVGSMRPSKSKWVPKRFYFMS